MTYLLLILLSFIFSAICGFIFIPLILKFCKERNIYDIPNARKIHKCLVPRLGGVCFLPSMLLAFFFTMCVISFSGEKTITVSMWTVTFTLGLFAIYVTGLIDDIVGLSPVSKLVMQIVAASSLPIANLYINNMYGLFGIGEIPAYVGIPLTIFVIVYMMNAINLIDGIDGLSGVLTLIALGGFLYIFTSQCLWLYGILIAALMGVLIPFLYHNVFGTESKGNKIFMGDSGSLSLGFILAFFFVKFSMDNPQVMPLRQDGMLMPLTLVMVPVFDVVRVTLVRLKAHQSIFAADKSHIHHKVIRAGASQYEALVVISVLECVFVVLNQVMTSYLSFTYILLIDIAIWIVFNAWLNRKISSLQKG